MKRILSKSLIAVFAACLVTGSFVACSDGSNDTPATTSTTPSSGNGGNTTTTDGNTTTTDGNTTTTGNNAEATATVRELAFSSTTLNNKVYSYESDGRVYYLTFTGGYCYESSSPNGGEVDNDHTIISHNNKIYTSSPATRTSGSGLFATFTADEFDDAVIKFKSNGTGSVSESGNSETFTFTNKAGVVTITYNDGFKVKALYNGTKLYFDLAELTYVDEY